VISTHGVQQLRAQLERIDVETIVQETRVADTNLAEASPSLERDELMIQGLGEALRPTAAGRFVLRRGLSGSRQARGLDLDIGTSARPAQSTSDSASDRFGLVLAERIADAFARLLSGS
jgi:hypothetical protein